MPRRKVVVVIPWRSCDLLLARLRELEGGRGVVNAFEAVGASQPVELSANQGVLLLKLIEDDWLGNDPLDTLPEGLRGLRDALQDDLNT
jgi:hypothetical protein